MQVLGDMSTVAFRQAESNGTIARHFQVCVREREREREGGREREGERQTDRT